MLSLRTRLGLTLAALVVLGLYLIGFLFPGDDRSLALRVLAYNNVPCSGITRLVRGFGTDDTFVGFGEGTMTLQCTDGTSYVLSIQLPCSETPGCRWFWILCWDVRKLP
jgi:hypothetical protein